MLLDMYSLLLVFPRSIRGSLHITHTCTCIGLWPPVNVSCSFHFLTWYQSARFSSRTARRNSVQNPPPSLLFVAGRWPLLLYFLLSCCFSVRGPSCCVWYCLVQDTALSRSSRPSPRLEQLVLAPGPCSAWPPLACSVPPRSASGCPAPIPAAVAPIRLPGAPIRSCTTGSASCRPVPTCSARRRPLFR
jgi:hypothetical protein